MQIFISWAKERSKQIGQAFSEFLPLLMEQVEPFFSPDDIAKGSRWLPDLSEKLDSISLGILCITPESGDSHWLMFEAGALSKSLTSARVFPVLFGIASSDLPAPLAQFQSCEFSQEEIFKLVVQINTLCQTPRNSTNLKRAFDLAWPEFHTRIEEILSVNPDQHIQKIQDGQKISEILDLVRVIERNNSKSNAKVRYMSKEQAEKIAKFASAMSDLIGFKELDVTTHITLKTGIDCIYQITSKAGFPNTTKPLKLLSEKFDDTIF